MATYWTIEAGGVEKTLAAWGVDTDVVLQMTNLEMGVLTVPVPGASITEDPIWAFEERITLWRGRTLTGSTWSGGTREFQGTRLLHTLDGRPTFEGVTYQFGDPWYHIRSCPYQQTVYRYDGDPEDLTEIMQSSVVLMQLVTGAGTWVMRNTGEQIGDILQHVLDQYAAQSLAAPFQIGTVDVAVNLPTYQAQDITCSEAIEYCLRCSPDARVIFDHSTAPPTVMVKSRGNCTAASVAIADGVKHESIRLVPRYDLQARSVVILFKRQNTVDETAWIEVVKQKYGPNGADSALDPDGGLRVVLQTVEMSGYSRTNVVGSLVTSGVENSFAWWKENVPELKSPRVVPDVYFPLVAGTFQIKDEEGNDVDRAVYPRKLEDGHICEWMRIDGEPIVSKRVTMSVRAAYQEMSADTGGFPFSQVKNKELTARVTLTNGVTGTYSATASGAEAEEIPTGLAQSIYEALATLQYDGQVTIVEAEVSGTVGMANTLNLTGGRTEWATMAAQINSIKREYGTGRTTITLGPARPLSASDLTRLFLINRGRRVWTDPGTQARGAVSGGGQVTLAKHLPKENTAAGLPQHQVFSVAAPPATGAAMIRFNAYEPEISMRPYQADGTPVIGSGGLSVILAACGARLLTVREVPICIDNELKHMLVIGTEPY